MIKTMVLLWLFGIGVGCFVLTGYCGLKYGTIPSKFDYVRYETWLNEYRKKHPDAEEESILKSVTN